MTRKYLVAAAFVVLPVLFSFGAYAQKAPKAASTPGVFQEMDTDGNKVVTREEYMAWRASHYKAKPGMSKVDYDAQSADLFGRRDRNKDGKLGTSEMAQLPPRKM